MKFFYIILTIIFSSCTYSSKQEEKIILVSGFSMDPSDPRFGLDLSPNKMYYCEEILNNRGKYNYYEANLSLDTFNNIKEDILLNFSKIKPFKPIVDARPYELSLFINGKRDVFKFYGNSLSDDQFAVLSKIVSLKNVALKKIDYHVFDQELLHEKSPGSFYNEE